VRRRQRTRRERAAIARIVGDGGVVSLRALTEGRVEALTPAELAANRGKVADAGAASLAATLEGIVQARDEQHYLRHEYVQALSHEGLMVLVRTLTFARDRDHRDDVMLDYIALELAHRQAPMCRVCECGEPGECDERCDWIAGARGARL
jgi:hypothetical protein